jgi:hypothetical protein
MPSASGFGAGPTRREVLIGGGGPDSVLGSGLTMADFLGEVELGLGDTRDRGVRSMPEAVAERLGARSRRSG